MQIKIMPLDTLFFRDGKPFMKGNENYASGVFPPSPSVIYGVLRSAFFANHIEDLPKAAEQDDPTAKLQLKGVFIQCGNEPHFPLPLDCVQIKSYREPKVFTLCLSKNEQVSNALPPYMLLPKDSCEVENVAGGLINDLTLQEYLSSPPDAEYYYIKLSHHLGIEPKVGIARDKNTHTAAESMLYRVEMLRLKDANLLVDFEQLELPPEGLLKIGGEGKAARYEKIERLHIEPPQIEDKYFKLYLATPAIFKGGWLPGWIDSKTLEGEFQGLRLRLLTACVGRYIPIGGFDIKRKRPKPMLRAVPAGSVYYFELADGKQSEIISAFHSQNISDIEPQQGFGLTYVGRVEL